MGSVGDGNPSAQDGEAGSLWSEFVSVGMSIFGYPAQHASNEYLVLLHSTFCLLLATFRESLANILYLNLVPVSTFQGVGYECSLADRRRCSTGNHAPEKHDVQTL